VPVGDGALGVVEREHEAAAGFERGGQGGGEPTVICDVVEDQVAAHGVEAPGRSHGRSDVSGRGYDLDTLAADIAAVSGHLDLREVVLVGHSLAAAEAVGYLAAHAGGRIAGLVLSAPAPRHSARGQATAAGSLPRYSAGRGRRCATMPARRYRRAPPPPWS
jgi:hypothetical protein